MKSVFQASLFTNKNVLVTGASSGIGKEIAIQCAIHGAKVWAIGRNWERLKEVQQTNVENIQIFSCDITKLDELSILVKNFEAIKFDGLVHAAGITNTLPLKFSTYDKWDEILDANVKGPMTLTQLLSKKQNIARQASIVFISSVMAEMGVTGKTLYAASKGAIHAAVKSIAIELAPKKIRVNSISPAVVQTPLSESSPYATNEDEMTKVKGQHPLGIGRVEDIAPTVLFLLSDAANWVTGADWKVDGGYSAQ